MKKILAWAVLFLPLWLFAQTDYKEMTDSAWRNMEQWNQLDEKLYASWANTNVRYAKGSVPNVRMRKSLSLKAWKGEKLNASLILWNNASEKEVSVSVGNLTSRSGAILPKENISVGIVRYVMTDEFIREGKTSCGFRENKADWDSSLVADVIDQKSNILLKKTSVSPVWLSIRVPFNAVSGEYQGKVTITENGKINQQLNLKIEVGKHVIPKASEWSFHLDLWQNPYAVSRFYGVEVWSEAHFDAMRPIMKSLADAGQKVITASIMHKPWNGQTYDYFESMINWTKKLDGSWKFNYDVFDKWVEFMMSLGINQQINCYSMVPWSFSFKYFDERLNDMAVVTTKPGETLYNEMWTAFLIDFAKHLKARGWFEKTCIAMDERPLPMMKIVLDLVHKADNNYKIALAGLYYPEIEKYLYDYCVSLDQTIPKEVLDKRNANHLVTTYYTYCADFKPNVFTFSNPAEASWMPIYVAKLGFTGYLRWAYNSWGEDPLRDSRFRQWPAGDTHIVYPGFRSSVRFEKLIEGIQQFEKIQCLKKEYAENSHVLGKIKNELAFFSVVDVCKEGNAEKVVERFKNFLNRF